jgi:hypothetical protein
MRRSNLLCHAGNEGADKPLEAMSVEELQEFRARYAAIVTASPMLIEHVIESEQAEQIAMDRGEQANANEVEGAPLAEEAAPFDEPAPLPRRRGRPRRRPTEEAGVANHLAEAAGSDARIENKSKHHSGIIGKHFSSMGSA